MRGLCSEKIALVPTAMSALLLAKILAAPGAELVRFIAFFVLPLACFARLEAQALKDLKGRWKLIALAPALLLGAVVYLLAFDALIALILGREPQEPLFVAYLFATGVGTGLLCLLLAGRKLGPEHAPSIPVTGTPRTRYRR